MMKPIITFLLFIILYTVKAQEEFSFQLVFVDAMSNSDTLILGYDPNASDSIDPDFGENNIENENWSKNFEVRITNAMKTRSIYDTIFNPSIQCKKQIVNHHCNEAIHYASSEIFIDVKCKYWPIIIMWDSLDFSDYCNKNSAIGFSELADMGYSFSKNSHLNTNDFLLDRLSDFYLTLNGDTIYSSFWLDFADSTMKAEVPKIDNYNFEIFPNPISDFINISIPEDMSQEKIFVDVFNSSGILTNQIRLNFSNKIDMRKQLSGIYYLKIYNAKTVFYIQKVIKN